MGSLADVTAGASGQQQVLPTKPCQDKGTKTLNWAAGEPAGGGCRDLPQAGPHAPQNPPTRHLPNRASPHRQWGMGGKVTSKGHQR